MQENRRISSIQKLAECGIMLALAVVLNEFTPFKLPFGGTVSNGVCSPALPWA